LAEPEFGGSMKIIEVKWNGIPIGHIKDPFFEMFNISGTWVPTLSIAYDLFLKEIASSEEESVTLQLGPGQVNGVVYEPPDTEIAVVTHLSQFD
jgi:hypothetical protein